MTDTTPNRPYHTQCPNLYDDSALSVYAFRLLFHIRRVAGDNGSCWEGARTLADKCRMSPGQVSKAKLELVKDGWIIITRKNVRGGFVDDMRPVDVWERNTQMYSKVSDHTAITNPPEQPVSQDDRPALESDHSTIAGDHTAITTAESDHTAITNGLSDHTAIAGDRITIESITMDQQQKRSRASRKRADTSVVSDPVDDDDEEPPTPIEIRQALAKVYDIDIAPEAKPTREQKIGLNREAKLLWAQQQARNITIDVTVAGIYRTEEYLRLNDWRYSGKNKAARLKLGAIRENWTIAGRWDRDQKKQSATKYALRESKSPEQIAADHAALAQALRGESSPTREAPKGIA